jgi:protein-S-isoprenylcysteine O-methyltransferase Ste14
MKSPAPMARYFLREILGLVAMGAALFWSAGRIDWWQAWAAIAVMTAWTAAMAVAVLRHGPALLAERLGPRKGQKPWDSAIVGLVGLAQLARYVIAGWDRRIGWTGDFALALRLAALTICALGGGLFVWAAASNAFFSRIVRIQTERGQRVVAGGPYRLVRHPAYLGAILYELALPFLLASWWALIAGGVVAALLVLRTVLEDRALRAELRGYEEYALRVRFRLLPGLW